MVFCLDNDNDNNNGCDEDDDDDDDFLDYLDCCVSVNNFFVSSRFT